MRKEFLFLFYFSLAGLVCGQNLVKNGSFEDYIVCPKSKNERFPLKIWKRLHNDNSTDYFNTSYSGCFDRKIYSPGHYLNTPYTTANTGNSFIGMYPICLNLKSNCLYGAMEPIIGELIGKLKKDSIYELSLSINLPFFSPNDVKSVSIVFMSDSITNHKPWEGYDFVKLFQSIRNKIVGIGEFDISSMEINKLNWKTIKVEYKAKGNEKYLLVGFYPDLSEEQIKYYDKLIEKGRSKKDYRRFYKELGKCYTISRKEEKDSKDGLIDAYLYIDDVSVELKNN